jgi:hypothetical protein
LIRRKISLTASQEADLRGWIKQAEFKDLDGDAFFSFNESPDEFLRGILCDFCRKWYTGAGLLSLVGGYFKSAVQKSIQLSIWEEHLRSFEERD